VGFQFGAVRMARVFVSHAGGDLRTAEMIASWLRAAGHRVFLDRDLEDGLKVGDVWGKRLFEELYQADALVAVVTLAISMPYLWLRYFVLA
jgi:hypothetical protein